MKLSSRLVRTASAAVIACAIASGPVAARTTAVDAAAQPGSTDQTSAGQDATPAAPAAEQTAVGQGAPAASPSTDPNEIIVTAQRRAENLQRVPLSVTALNSTQLTSQGIRTVADLGGKIPGLTVQKFNGIVQPFLRGVGSSTSTAGVESSVAVYMDGVYFSRLPSAFFDLSDVERVEVLKGPQGTLFGRNSTGGVINVVTRDPSYKPEMNGSIGYGRFNEFNGNLYVSAGLSEKAAASLSLVAKTSDGFGKDLITGNRYGYEDSMLANGKLLLQPSDDTKIVLGGFYSWSKNSGNKGAFPGTSSIGLNYYYDQTLGLGLGIPRTGQVYGDNAPGAQKVPFYDSVSNPDQQEIFHVYGGSLHVDQQLGFAKLVSISAYSHVSQDSQYTDYVPLDEFLVPAHARVNLYTQELQLVSNPDAPFDWIVGAYYLNNKTYYNSATVFDIPLFYGNTPLVAPGQEKIETFAAFGQVGYAITSKLKLTGGFRYTWDKTSAQGTVGGKTAYAPDTNKVHKPSYKVALDYQITPKVMVYGLYSHGFKSGAYNILTYSSPPTKPEQLDDFELGFKSELFDNVVRFNAAGFYYKIKNPQVQLIQNGTTFLSNGQSARVKGGEADVAIRAAQGLNLRGSVTYLDAYYTKYTNAPAGRPDFVLGGSVQLPNIDASGNRLPFAAKWSFNVGGDYSFDSGIGKVTLTADWFHNSGYTFEPDQFLKQGAYDLINAQVKLQLTDHVAVRVWGRNLANQKIVAAAATQYGYAGYAFSPAPPVTYGGAVDFKF